MRVLVTNTVLLNGGDAAILLALLRQLREAFGPELEVTVMEAQPELAREYYPDLPLQEPIHHRLLRGENKFIRGAKRYAGWYVNLFRFYRAAAWLQRGRSRAARMLLSRREWEVLQRYASADLVISTGGTYLVENYWLSPRIFEYRLVLSLGRPLAFYTQSIGPFERKRNQRAFRTIFRRALLVLLRDRASLAHLVALGDAAAEDNVHVVADAAFSLADPQVLRDAAQRPVQQGQRLRVAISVREWHYFQSHSQEAGMQAYIGAVAEAVVHLVRTCGAEVTFISTCQGSPGYRYDDAAVAEDLVVGLPADVQQRVRVDRAFHRPEALIEVLTDFDLVVATRMHMAILALAAGTLVVPIAYEFKTEALFERLGMARWVQDIEHLTASGLIGAVDTLLACGGEVRPELFARVEAERERALSAGAYLRRAYLQWQHRSDG